MKLTKEYQGSYFYETTINGDLYRWEMSSGEKEYWGWTLYVNGSLRESDGWYGLRLKNIKEMIAEDIERLKKVKL